MEQKKRKKESCKNCGELISGWKTYCNLKCRDEDWSKRNYNPFKGKKHTEESIKKFKNHPNYINRKFKVGWKHTEETIKKMSKPRKKQGKEWNCKYRHDVKYEGKQRVQIIEWCGEHGGIPDEIASIWFKSCQNCGWNLAKCDLHHIISVKEGGKSTLNNLINLCRSCHRLTHVGKIDIGKIKT